MWDFSESTFDIFRCFCYDNSGLNHVTMRLGYVHEYQHKLEIVCGTYLPSEHVCLILKPSIQLCVQACDARVCVAQVKYQIRL